MLGPLVLLNFKIAEVKRQNIGASGGTRGYAAVCDAGMPYQSIDLGPSCSSSKPAPCIAPGKAVDDASSTWAVATCVGASHGVPASCLWPGPVTATISIQ